MIEFREITFNNYSYVKVRYSDIAIGRIKSNFWTPSF